MYWTDEGLFAFGVLVLVALACFVLWILLRAAVSAIVRKEHNGPEINVREESTAFKYLAPGEKDKV